MVQMTDTIITVQLSHKRSVACVKMVSRVKLFTRTVSPARCSLLASVTKFVPGGDRGLRIWAVGFLECSYQRLFIPGNVF